jgi:FkbM family methyltransferase
VVVDAGGFVGDTALCYADQGARVYSFEPDERNYGLLKKILSLNPDLGPQVTPVRLALGRDGTVDLPWGQGGGASEFASGRDRQRVESTSLHSTLDRYGITDPFLLHLDVKGVEAGVEVIGTSIVGSDVRIGAGSRVGPYCAVGNRVSIQRSHARRSLLLKGEQVDRVHIDDGLVGPNVEIRARGPVEKDLVLMLGDSSKVIL